MLELKTNPYICKIKFNKMEKNEVKKYLYRNKELMAKFSHYVSGNLYYTVQLEDGVYQFPISTVDKVNTPLFRLDGKTQASPSISMSYTRVIEEYSTLSSDLGTTDFSAEIKASFLNRWIDKAIDKGEFIKL